MPVGRKLDINIAAIIVGLGLLGYAVFTTRKEAD